MPRKSEKFLTFAIFMTRIRAVSKSYQYLLKFGVCTLYSSSLSLSLTCALCFFLCFKLDLEKILIMVLLLDGIE